MERVVRKCHEKGFRFFEDVEYRGKMQEHIELAMNFLRAIVEVMPRGRVDKPVKAWKEEMWAYGCCLHGIKLAGESFL